MVIGMNKAFGMFFVEYIETFDSSSSMISTVISVQQVMFSLSCKYSVYHDVVIYVSIVTTMRPY